MAVWQRLLLVDWLGGLTLTGTKRSPRSLRASALPRLEDLRVQRSQDGGRRMRLWWRRRSPYHAAASTLLREQRAR